MCSWSREAVTLCLLQGQLNSMTCGLRVLKMALAKGNPEGQPSRFESTEAALKHTVEQWQSLRRDSQTRQLATFVKNLDSFFDIMINIVHMRENFEVRCLRKQFNLTATAPSMAPSRR